MEKIIMDSDNKVLTEIEVDQLKQTDNEAEKSQDERVIWICYMGSGIVLS